MLVTFCLGNVDRILFLAIYYILFNLFNFIIGIINLNSIHFKSFS